MVHKKNILLIEAKIILLKDNRMVAMVYKANDLINIDKVHFYRLNNTEENAMCINPHRNLPNTTFTS